MAYAWREFESATQVNWRPPPADIGSCPIRKAGAASAHPLALWLRSTRPPTTVICGLLAPRRDYRSRAVPPTCASATAATVQGPLASTPASAALRSLHPQSPLLVSGHLQVSDLHTLYYEVYGTWEGIPALSLHGGPGAGSYTNHARFFDPARYCVVLFDQRGCGRSTPRGCLRDNHTAALVADCEALRRHLRLPRWLVLGGSWGATLALAYAQSHPSSLLGLVLRGVCLMRPSEISWVFGGGAGGGEHGGAGAGGAAALRPLAWRAFIAHLGGSQAEAGNPLLAYYRRLLSPDAAVRDAAAQAWLSWEMAVSSQSDQLVLWDGAKWSAQDHPGGGSGGSARPRSKPQQPPLPAIAGDGDGASLLARLRGASRTLPQPPQQQAPSSPAAAAAAAKRPPSASPWVWGSPVQGFNVSDAAVRRLVAAGLAFEGSASMPSHAAHALLTAHYSLHAGFLLAAPLLAHAARLAAARMPCIAVQGQADLVCPPAAAAALQQAWPHMELRLVPGAGHSMYDPRIRHELLGATDRMADTLAGSAARRARARRRDA